MSGHDELSLRKDMLLAQSALYRAQLRYEVLGLHTRLSRVSGWVTRGLTILSIVRTVLSVVAVFRKG